MKPLKIAGLSFAGLIALLLILTGGLFAALNTAPGQNYAASLIGKFTAGRVQAKGLSGGFPASPRLVTLVIADAQGPWLEADDITLDWSPWALIHRRVAIQSLTARQITAFRRPVSSEESSGSSKLPVTVSIGHLGIDNITLAPALVPGGATANAVGSLVLTGRRSGTANLVITRRDAPGSYNLDARIDEQSVDANMILAEPANGLISGLTNLPGLGALKLTLALQGPWNDIALRLQGSSGPLQLVAGGTVDGRARRADLDVSAHSPAMALRPDLRWQTLALESHVHGSFAAPQAMFHLTLQNAQFGGTLMSELQANGTATEGQAQLTASLAGLKIPGSQPDLFANAPIEVTASATLGAKPVGLSYHVTHPLFDLTGTAQLGTAQAMQAHLMIADLGAQTGEKLRGPATIDLNVTRNGNAIAIDHITMQNQAVQLQLSGNIAAANDQLNWQLNLPDLHVFVPKLNGHLAVQGTLAGPDNALVAKLTATGAAATPGQPLDPLTMQIEASGFPNNPNGSVEAHGKLDGAQIDLTANAAKESDGTIDAHITQGKWLGAQLSGDLTLAPGAQLPTGTLALRIAQLANFHRLTSMALAGSVTANINLTKAQVRVTAQVNSLKLNQIGIAQSKLEMTVKDPLHTRSVAGTLTASGIAAQGVAGTLRLTATGNQNALTLNAQSNLTMRNQPLNASLTGKLEANAKLFTLSAFEADYQNQTLSLLSPARVSFGSGVALDQLRLGWRDAVATLAGKISPAPDLRLQIGPLPASLIASVDPNLPLSGTMQAQGTLTGSWQHPQANATIALHQLRMTQGDAAALPAANLDAKVALEGSAVRIDGQFRAGKNHVTIQGTAGSSLDLQANGNLDLDTLDALLTAQGQHLGGQATLATRIQGTMAAPQASGTLKLSGGSWQSYTLGAHLTAIEATLVAQGSSLQLTHLSAKAGDGSCTGSGQIGLMAPYPVSLAIKGQNARPIASDQLTATMNSDLQLQGDLNSGLTLDGTVRIQRADVAVPDAVASQVAVLNVRRPGQAVAASAPARSPVALSIDLISAGQIFIRGRGLDAELEGMVHVGGSAADPQPVGQFTLRRGSFSLAGQPLNFTSGEIGFEGGGRIDPTLNFVATSNTSSITATLTVTGTASSPKITLSSTPEMPQDEILAQLLFHTSASNLNALQLAETAAGLAQIAGGSSGGFNPLNSIRTTLGLDSLSVVNSDTNNGSAVQAGRYVTKRVYVGASQDTSGGGTPRVTVQVDLLKGLKLETNVATSSSAQPTTTGASSTIDTGTNVGLTYQFEY